MASITRTDLGAALPDLRTTLRLAGLDAPVLIERDPWGIPHIRAKSEADLYLGQGFATAQDRLWQMDYDRRRCLGRWAECVGAQGLANDRMLRRRGLAQAARADYDACSPAARAMLDAYAEGVNAFLQTTASLPVEYRLLDTRPDPWEPWHSLLVYKMRNTAEGSFLQKLFLGRLAATLGPERAAALVPGYPRGHLLTVPPGALYDGPTLNGMAELATVAAALAPLREIDLGSNAWVVAGARTASGLPLLAGDSHRGLDTPNVYYQIHLACPDFDVIGQALPGFPGALHFCHNQHVAWGMTYGSCDTQDLFVEEVRAHEGSLQYRFLDEWRTVQQRSEVIRVRGAAPETVTARATHHGAVIAGDPAAGRLIALADPGAATPTAWVDAAREAMHARSADELEAALAGWTDRVNNYVYADVSGAFGYALRGRVPLRPESNGWGPVPGWNGRHEWNGYIPPAELPRSRNPKSGYLVSCNQRIADGSYPYFLGHLWSPAYRAHRITERLNALPVGEITVREMASIHADAVSLMARKLSDAVARLDLHGDSARAQRILTSWDGRLTADAPAPAIYAALQAEWDARIVQEAYGPLARDILAGTDAGGAGHYARGVRSHVIEELGTVGSRYLPIEEEPAMLGDALESAVRTLTERAGPDPDQWCWGALHHTMHTHPLAAAFPQAAQLLHPPQVAAAGGGDTPLAGSFALHGSFTVEAASVARYVHDPADWTRCRWIVPLGASGHPGSPHYADQQQAWAAVDTIPQLWDRAVIRDRAESAQHLQSLGTSAR